MVLKVEINTVSIAGTIDRAMSAPALFNLAQTATSTGVLDMLAKACALALLSVATIVVVVVPATVVPPVVGL